MTTDKKLIARVTALVHRFLELIEIIRHDVRTRTAPNSLRLEGDNKARVLELAKEGMLIEETLVSTIDSFTTIFDDASFILKGGNPLNLKQTLPGNVFAEPDDVFTTGATNAKGSWLIAIRSGGLVVSHDGGNSFNKPFDVEEEYIDIVYRSGYFYLLSVSGALSIVKESNWSLSTVRYVEGSGVTMLRPLEDDLILLLGPEQCFAFRPSVGNVAATDLEGVQKAEVLSDGRLLVVNLTGGVMMTKAPFEISGNSWSIAGSLEGAVIDTSYDLAGYCSVLTDQGVFIYDVSKGIWHTSIPQIEQNLNSIYMDNRGMMVCSTDGGWLVRSVDYGVSWSPVLTNTEADLLNVFGGLRPEGSSVLCVVGESKYIAISS